MRISELKKSREKFGEIYPVLVDQHGNLIDGIHRKKVNPNWKETKVNVKNEKEREELSLISNVQRRNIKGKEITEKLGRIAEVMKQYNGTGVQQTINRAVFDLLDMIVVYPVEDENHFCNKKGEVLPDAFLMRKGSTPHDLAYQVHTDIGKGFLYAVDARTKMRIKENLQLKDGDIIKVISVH